MTDNNNNNSKGITIRVLFFASAREAVGGVSEVLFTFPTKVDDNPAADTEQLRIQLAEQYPSLSTLILDRESVTLAVNEVYAYENVTLQNGDVVAIIPPISGG